MSRIGKMPIEIPGGVEVKVDGRTVHVKGSQGELAQQLPDGIQVAAEEGTLTVSRESEAQRTRAMHGLTRSLIANMVEGVSKGFQKSLEIHGVGYRASLQGTKLVLSVGFSHPVEMQAPEGIQFEVPQPTRVIVKGISKELVGQVAADIRAVRPPEPYLAKGIRYEGERIRRKAGKAGRAG